MCNASTGNTYFDFDYLLADIKILSSLIVHYRISVTIILQAINLALRDSVVSKIHSHTRIKPNKKRAFLAELILIGPAAEQIIN